MSFLQNFDRLSFWLGFLTACVFSWLAVRLWRKFPQVRESLSKRFTSMRAQQAAGLDGILRHEVLKRAQRNHLAGPLFSLDEILITPRLLAPPPQVDPDHPDPIGSFRPPILPNLPVVPQFSAQYGGESLPLVRVVRSGADVAIIGHPGAGKSTALAYLASLFARKDASLGQIASYFPIYLHVNDLEDPSVQDRDPVDVLIKGLAWHVPASSRPGLASYINKMLSSQKAVLLLDGLDEISYDAYLATVGYLGRLTKARAKLRIVTTGSLDRAHGLFDLGIEPMPIAGWSRYDTTAFSKKWGTLWNTHFAPSTTPDNGHSLDDILINSWQGSDGGFYTPMELTTRLWGAYAGNLSGVRGVDAISSYFGLVESQGVHLLAVASIADQMISMKQSYTSFVEAEKEFNAAGSPYSNLLDDLGTKTDSPSPAFQTPLDNLRLDRKLRTSSLEEKSIDKLIELGVLREHPHDRLAFTSPVLWGYVASLSNYTYDLSGKSPDDDPWSAASEFFHYLLASTPAEWLKSYLAGDVAPFQWRSTQAALWMRDLNPGNANRSFIMRQVLTLAQLESLPYPARLGLLAAAAMSNDPALVVLMKQLAGSSSVPLKQIATLCAGLLGDPKSISDLTAAGGDEQELVRFAACFAIAALETPESQATLENTINQADEPMRLAVAEAVSARPPWGYKLLREAAASADILTRRAAIFGLMQIRASWVSDIIEKLAIEDGQYAVRNYAGMAQESLQKSGNKNQGIPTSPYDTPWLIAYAAKNGRGVPRNESPVPLLLKVAKTGTPEQQTAAVQLLARCNDASAIDGIREAIAASDLDLRVTAYHSLWFNALNQSKVK